MKIEIEIDEETAALVWANRTRVVSDFSKANISGAANNPSEPRA